MNKQMTDLLDDRIDWLFSIVTEHSCNLTAQQKIAALKAIAAAADNNNQLNSKDWHDCVKLKKTFSDQIARSAYPEPEYNLWREREWFSFTTVVYENDDLPF